MPKSFEELVDGLAISVAQGFERTEKRFDQLHERFEQMNQRFDAVEHRLERVEFLVTGQDQRISILEDRMRQIATKVGVQYR